MGVEPPNLPCGYASSHCCKPQPSVIIIIVIIIIIGHYLSIYLSRKHKTYGNHIREQDS